MPSRRIIRPLEARHNTFSQLTEICALISKIVTTLTRSHNRPAQIKWFHGLLYIAVLSAKQECQWVFFDIGNININMFFFVLFCFFLINYDNFLFAIYIRIAKCRTCEIIKTIKKFGNVVVMWHVSYLFFSQYLTILTSCENWG